MKKAYLVILLLLFALPVHAAVIQGMVGGGVPAASVTYPTSWFTDGNGFESPWAPKTNLGNWYDWGSGSMTAETATYYKKGSVSMKSTATNCYMDKAELSAQLEVWGDFWIYAAAVTGDTDLVRLLDAGYGHSIDMYMSAGNLLVYNDGWLDLDTTIDIAATTWTHVFFHYIYGSTNNGTVEVATSTTDAKGAWDYSGTTADYGADNVGWTGIRFGAGGNSTPITIYYDAFRSWYGAGSPPAEWD